MASNDSRMLTMQLTIRHLLRHTQICLAATSQGVEFRCEKINNLVNIVEQTKALI